jgi:hypothetical protein
MTSQMVEMAAQMGELSFAPKAAMPVMTAIAMISNTVRIMGRKIWVQN